MGPISEGSTTMQESDDDASAQAVALARTEISEHKLLAMPPA